MTYQHKQLHPCILEHLLDSTRKTRLLVRLLDAMHLEIDITEGGVWFKIIAKRR